jgi:hypothetical protein
MTTIHLGDYLTAPADGMLDHTPYEHLEKADLAEFLAAWNLWHEQAGSRSGSTPPPSSATT